MPLSLIYLISMMLVMILKKAMDLLAMVGIQLILLMLIQKEQTLILIPRSLMYQITGIIMIYHLIKPVIISLKDSMKEMKEI